jgi:hypothetical protein
MIRGLTRHHLPHSGLGASTENIKKEITTSPILKPINILLMIDVLFSLKIALCFEDKLLLF